MRQKRKSRSQWQEIFIRLKRNRVAMFGLFILLSMAIVILTADLYIDYNEDIIQQDVKIKLEGPSKEHPFGTDSFGRDIMYRIIYGGRISLTIGILVTVLSLFIGSFIGAIAGYYGGLIDNVFMRCMDILMAVPPILLAIAVVSALGPGMINLMIALSIAGIPGYARLIRSSVLTIKDAEFIEAAMAYGSRDYRIIIKHITPNTVGPLIVQATLGVASTIIAAASLSFLGLGIMPPVPEWGAMLSEGKEYIRYSPYLVFFPGVAIMFTVLSLNLLGDGLRDALDPRLKN
ncbi:ABC transporter permease [Acidaminobacter sp. JC074]|uniref:ABC transporter permease n=1 Tax=Acidaminobacter sp. JC074 TaxID=2530199 RepID=UPI001F1142CA|nr:ABC transporter permease [Acidaminobacter sp. JC074]MCH4886318.1 ABC transporter permease [Acidaminobacter sp. JC074]